MLLTRNIVMEGRRTTLRIERAIWQAMDELCVRERISLGVLCHRIDRARQGGARAAAVRAVVSNYFRYSLRDSRAVSILDAAIRDMAGEP
ncbi:MAG: ribbon-helix-helix domain-containing protein [Proteobacteria bacterium]|nr:ribbon-helix-helix domain-containing protein [Pseudomonadota bacterium]